MSLRVFMGKNKEGKFNIAMGAIIEHKKTGNILLIKRSEKKDFAPGIWEYPIGRLKQFEDPINGLKREIKEETGLNVKVIKPLCVFHIFTRTKNNSTDELIGISYWCVSNSDKIKLSSEHTDYKWLKPKSALRFITDHKGIRENIKVFLKEKNNL